MSVSLTAVRWQYVPNGVTTSFAYLNLALSANDISCALYDANGVEVVLSSYTVTGLGDAAGGTVVFSTAPSVTATPGVLVIELLSEAKSDIACRDFTMEAASERQAAWDRSVLLGLQARAGLARTIRLNRFDAGPLAELPKLSTLLNKYLAVSAAGAIIGSAGPSTVPISSAMEAVVQAVSIAAGRTAMGVAGLGANTFTGAQTLPGNAGTALEAVPKQQAESIAAAAAASAAVPVGTPLWWPTDTPPAGYLVRDGSLISRTTYAALFAVLVTQPGYIGQIFTVTIASPGVVTKAAHGFFGGERLRLTTTGALPSGLAAGSEYFVIYVAADTFRLASSEVNCAAGTAISTTGSQSGVHTYTRSLYGLGDGATTFRLPDDLDLFTRGKPASGRSLGVYQRDAIRNITAAIGVEAVLYSANGAFGTDAAFDNDGGYWGAGVGPQGLTFNASLVVPTGPQNVPVNRTYLPIMKYQ